MTQKEKITSGLDKDLKQLIDTEMNDPVLGKLLNKNAVYVLGKEIKLVLIDKACEWLNKHMPFGETSREEVVECINDFKKAMLS